MSSIFTFLMTLFRITSRRSTPLLRTHFVYLLFSLLSLLSLLPLYFLSTLFSLPPCYYLESAILSSLLYSNYRRSQEQKQRRSLFQLLVRYLYTRIDGESFLYMSNKAVAELPCLSCCLLLNDFSYYLYFILLFTYSLSLLSSFLFTFYNFLYSSQQ